MGAYFDSLIAARAQRRARMQQPVATARPGEDAAALTRFVGPAGQPSAAASREIARILLRLEALERRLAALADSSLRLADCAPAVPDASPRPKVSEVKCAISRAYGVTEADLDGQSRLSSLVRARQIAMYLARRLTGKSLLAIARMFGDRDHTTVLHACRRIERLRLADAGFDRALQALAAQILSDTAPEGAGEASAAADQRDTSNPSIKDAPQGRPEWSQQENKEWLAADESEK